MLKQPLYEQVYQKMKKSIRNGEYNVGEFLPTESELEIQYNVSRTTIRKVIMMLVTDKYIEVKQGRGTSVLDFDATQKLNGITSISETLIKRGMDVSSVGIYVDTILGNDKISNKLGIDRNQEISRIQRVILADGLPIAIVENYICSEKVPNIMEKIKNINSLYKFIEDEYKIELDFAKVVIQPEVRILRSLKY